MTRPHRNTRCPRGRLHYPAGDVRQADRSRTDSDRLEFRCTRTRLSADWNRQRWRAAEGHCATSRRRSYSSVHRAAGGRSCTRATSTGGHGRQAASRNAQADPTPGSSDKIAATACSENRVSRPRDGDSRTARIQRQQRARLHRSRARTTAGSAADDYATDDSGPSSGKSDQQHTAAETMTDSRRDLPSVGSLLETAGVKLLLEQHPRRVVVDAVRDSVEAARAAGGGDKTQQQWLDTISSAIRDASRPSLRRVINATGVILHTNLGRAPLPEAAIHAIQQVAEGFSNLEYDIATGQRGSRYSHCVGLLTQLTGAEDALVVNNCAAAMVLTLNALAQKKEVLVSRGELVEIGGSFRIPDIMARSGAKLVEVGTTNRTHDDDYRRAITPKTGAIVKVHRSNFAIEGFTADVSVEGLVFIAAEHGLPVVHDLGSGLMLSLDAYGLTGEPTASTAIASGATLVLMSGDKLLGGPQAGIILGKAAVIARLRKRPPTRAMRVDKLTLSALEATLRISLDPSRAFREIPVLSMLTAHVEQIESRARAVAAALVSHGTPAEVAPSVSSVGGGAFPTAEIPSRAVVIGGDVTAFEERLRLGEPAVISRISEQRLWLDMRSVQPREDAALTTAVLRARA